VLDSGTVLASGTAEKIVAAMPGSLRAVAARPEGEAAARSWRRAGTWRVWDPDSGGLDAGSAAGEVITPDLQDAVTVAALAATPGGAA
jgi:hypothetical protein